MTDVHWFNTTTQSKASVRSWFNTTTRGKASVRPWKASNGSTQQLTGKSCSKSRNTMSVQVPYMYEYSCANIVGKSLNIGKIHIWAKELQICGTYIILSIISHWWSLFKWRLKYTPLDLLFKTEFLVVCLKEFSEHGCKYFWLRNIYLTRE